MAIVTKKYLKINDDLLLIEKKDINVIIHDKTPFLVQEVIGFNDCCVQCINVDYVKGEGDSIINILSPNLEIGLTSVYLNHLKMVFNDSNCILLIEVMGVDPKGFDAIYNYIENNVHKILCVVLFIELDLFTKSFDLEENTCVLINRNQIKLADTDSSYECFSITGMDKNDVGAGNTAMNFNKINSPGRKLMKWLLKHFRI